jgi:hypothetical protein
MSPSVGQGILEAAKLDLGMHGTPCLSGLSGFRDLLGLSPQLSGTRLKCQHHATSQHLVSKLGGCAVSTMSPL